MMENVLALRKMRAPRQLAPSVVSFGATIITTAIALTNLSTPSNATAESEPGPSSEKASTQTSTVKTGEKPAEKPVVVSVAVSAPGAQAPEGLFDGKSFEARPTAEFVKLQMAFDPPIAASKIALESCGGEFKDGVEFFIFPGNSKFYAEGGHSEIKATVDNPSDDKPGDIRSLAINFRHNSGICLKSLRFLDRSGQPIEIRSALSGIEPPPSLAKDADLRREKFSAAGLEVALDHELRVASDDGKWIFRFRSDGTFFVYGVTDEAKTAGRFTALGEYDILDVEGKNKIKLSLKGRRLVTADPWDGWLCGHPCGERELAARVSPVVDTVVVERLRKGGFMVRNRVTAKRRTLPFSDLQVRPSIP